MAGERVPKLDANEGDWQRLEPAAHDELNDWVARNGLAEPGLIQCIELSEDEGKVLVTYLADGAGEPTGDAEAVAIVGQAYPDRIGRDGAAEYDAGHGPLRAACVTMLMDCAEEPPAGWPRVP